MFDKYSNKCLNFILKNQLYSINKNKLVDDTFNSVISILNKLSKKKYYNTELLEKKLLKKINNTNYPLLFNFLKKNVKKKVFDDYIKLGKLDNIQIKNLIINIDDQSNNFNKWYNENIDNITKTTCLLSKNKKTSVMTILEDYIIKNNDRKPLNRMMYNNPFISLDIQYFSESNDLYYYKYFNDNIQLHIYSKEEIKEELIKNILLMCNLISEISNTKFKKNDICILLSPFKKVIHNNQSKILCSNNVNSGSTLTGSYINIWRSEELLKVLCHELIHFFDIDFYDYDNIEKQNLINRIKKIFNIEGKIIPFEAYTDSCSIIIHSIFIGYKLSYSINETYKLLSLEICYILFQAAKVLYNFNFEKFDDYKKNKVIRQGTAVFSYYIIKSSLLFSLNNFINFSGINFNFDNRIKKFNNLIFNSLDNPNYINLINDYINIIKNNKENKYVFYNLRMSCVQIL
jgi:hypothetical protein